MSVEKRFAGSLIIELKPGEGEKKSSQFSSLLNRTLLIWAIPSPRNGFDVQLPFLTLATLSKQTNRLWTRVTRLGEISSFGRFFMALGNFFLEKMAQ
jgi:hypothetical protein